MKATVNNNNNESCELIQLSISNTIDANKSLNHADNKHISSCNECSSFYQLWQSDSAISAIASGSLLIQKDLTHLITSQLEQDSVIMHRKEKQLIRGQLFKLASIAAVIAIISAFIFYGIEKDEQTLITTKTPEKSQIIEIKKINLTLTEAEIEKMLQENYQTLSKSATDKWKIATSSIARATEYIGSGTHYISKKYLVPENKKSSDSQSRLTPQQAELNPHQYG
jgi:hypothetical protein